MKYYHNMACSMNGNPMGQGFCNRCGGGGPVNPMVGGVRRIIDSEYPLAMAYVPWQSWNETYPLETALCKATLFPELDLPFTGCQRRNCHG